MANFPRDSDHTARGLRLFLERFTALQIPIHTTAAGFVRYLQRAAPFLHTASSVSASPPSQPAIDPLRLEEILRRLAKPIAAAGTGGAFLNVWSVAGLGRSELRNAAVLAWFLNPRAPHGLGSTVLSDFLDLAATRGGWSAFGTNLSRATVCTEEWPLGSKTDRVDIAIDDDEFVIFVEVKIDAGEGPDQLQRYLLAAKEKAKALRRPRGHVVYVSPRRPSTDNFSLAVLTWSDIARLILSRQHAGFGGALARQFARHIQIFS